MSNELNTEDVISPRVMKTSLERLVMDNDHKRHLIKSIDKLVLLNSKIAVRGSMIMNYTLSDADSTLFDAIITAFVSASRAMR